MRGLSFFLLMFAAEAALSFPEMIRHGYIHCTACHTNLAGGGLLNDYGRTLSKELLSSGGSFEGDEGFLYGVKTPEWLMAGGDLRTLQTFVESKQASRGRFLIMQVDLDAQAKINDRWSVFGSIGRIEPKVDSPEAKDFVSSPRHGVEYLITAPDDEVRWTARAGRFMPVYGINFAEHVLLTRSLLDFDASRGQERYNLEISRVDDQSSLVLTGLFSRSAGNQNKPEKGATIQYARALGSMAKASVNYYETTRDDGAGPWRRRIYGLNALVGFTKEWFGLFEFDRPQGADEKWGFVETSKVGKEISPGWQVFAIHEYAVLDSSKADPRLEAYSLATQWFPRPHWDLYAAYRKERNTGVSDDFQDVVWLIAHFYL